MSLRPLRLVAGAILALVAAACASHPAADSFLPATEAPRDPDWAWVELGPNDLVRVTVYGHPEASLRAEGERIDPDGLLTLPLAGTLSVGGLTPDEARRKIQRALSGYYRDPRVQFSVLRYEARRFYVFGHVDQPGAYTLDRPVNALQALAMGGKFLRGAKRDQVLLLRRNGDVFDVYEFDSEHPDEGGLVAIRPDDVLFVGRSASGRFAEDLLPFLQGAGFAAAVPVGLSAVGR